ncbi:MAG: tRNA-dihydrouridine synthase B [Chlamydiia bacterium]|nr:tRNA-dihydrouridine synthase B [Chlamydiia bacterium]
MQKPFRPIQIGPLKLKNNVFYSPLAGVSDYPFREIVSRYRPGLFFCEMVKMEALTRGDRGTFRLLDYTPNQHPIGAQIVGGNESLAAQSAKIIEDLGFDLVDLNCGCPVDKVTKDGSGSGLLKTPEKIGNIIANMVSAVKIPVTVKIRAGWDEESINSPLITRIAEEAGAKVITIHGRTRKQAYKGPANWDFIKACKAEANNILVFGNGDVFSRQAALDMFDQTNCDGLLASRGTMGKPFLIQEILGDLSLSPEEEIDFQFQAFLDHFEIIRRYHPPARVLIELRKIGSWYLKGSSRGKALRDRLNKSRSLDEVLTAIDLSQCQTV